MNSVNRSYLIERKNNSFSGIFSERDYSRNVMLKGLHSDSCPVSEVRSTSLPVVDLNESVEKCMQLLNSHKTRYLLVFDQGEFRGVITINDVLREAIANKDSSSYDEAAMREAAEMQDHVF